MWGELIVFLVENIARSCKIIKKEKKEDSDKTFQDLPKDLVNQSEKIRVQISSKKTCKILNIRSS